MYVVQHIYIVLFLKLVFVANKTTNVSVKLSEKGRPDDKSAFYARGNITINASTILPVVGRINSPLSQSRTGW